MAENKDNLILYSDKKKQFINPVLRFGDLDLDGNRDFIVNVRKREGEYEDKPFLMAFKNLGCPDDLVNSLKNENSEFKPENCRYFESSKYTSNDQFKNNFKEISSKISILTSFFDWGEMG